MKRNQKKIPTFYLWQQLRCYLQEYLPAVRNASPQTIATYQDSLQRFIDFLTEKKGIFWGQMGYTFFALSPKRIPHLAPERTSIETKNLQPSANSYPFFSGLQCPGRFDADALV